jgi:hypothetical protein
VSEKLVKPLAEILRFSAFTPPLARIFPLLTRCGANAPVDNPKAQQNPPFWGGFRVSYLTLPLQVQSRFGGTGTAFNTPSQAIA